MSEFALTRRDRLSSHAPLHFDLSVLDLFAAAAAAAAVVLIPRDVTMFPAELAEFARTANISVWYSVPSAVSMLASRCQPEVDGMPGLRLMLFAGEVFPMDQLRAALKAFPNVEFYNLYGPTETNAVTFYHVARPLTEDRTSIPIGVPIGRGGAILPGRRRESGRDQRTWRTMGQWPDGHARLPERSRANRKGPPCARSGTA